MSAHRSSIGGSTGAPSRIADNEPAQIAVPAIIEGHRKNRYLTNAAIPRMSRSATRSQTKLIPAIIELLFCIMGCLSHASFCRLIRKLFPTTLTLDIAIAAAAIIGFRKPNAARGIAAML